MSPSVKQGLDAIAGFFDDNQKSIDNWSKNANTAFQAFLDDLMGTKDKAEKIFSEENLKSPDPEVRKGELRKGTSAASGKSLGIAGRTALKMTPVIGSERPSDAITALFQGVDEYLDVLTDVAEASNLDRKQRGLPPKDPFVAWLLERREAKTPIFKDRRQVAPSPATAGLMEGAGAATPGVLLPEVGRPGLLMSSGVPPAASPMTEVFRPKESQYDPSIQPGYSPGFAYSQLPNQKREADQPRYELPLGAAYGIRAGGVGNEPGNSPVAPDSGNAQGRNITIQNQNIDFRIEGAGDPYQTMDAVDGMLKRAYTQGDYIPIDQ